MMTYPSSRKATENTVEKAVIAFMQARSWRATRNHVGLFQTVYGGKISIGKEGFPDWTFTRGSKSCYGRSELMHVELKKPGKKPKPRQHEVMASLNHIGELAVWADSLEMYERIYSQYFT